MGAHVTNLVAMPISCLAPAFGGTAVAVLYDTWSRGSGQRIAQSQARRADGYSQVDTGAGESDSGRRHGCRQPCGQ